MKQFLQVLLLILIPMSLFSQTSEEKTMITKNYSEKKLNSLSEAFRSKAEFEKKKAIELASQKNWPITKEEDGRYYELMKVSEEGYPIYYTTFNVDAAKSTRANTLHNGGILGLNIEGQNMEAHVWDAGLARSTHQEYDGIGGNNRFSIGDGSTTLHYHSAHVTGTIIASGYVASAKGMAPQAHAIGYDWNLDISEASTAAGAGMLISNHSYGWDATSIPDWYFGAYIGESRDWDAVLYSAQNYLMVVAAGNDGNDNSSNGNPLNGNSSYDKLSGHTTCKNNMVVANALDANIDGGGNLISVSINSGSSEGPTDDYRIKPDITGNGTGLYSTYQNADNAYASISGTSMASPNVAGTLLLLQQHYNELNSGFMRAATLKGLALHTADDAGPSGPDAVYGWGLLNGKAAAEAISNNGDESIISELTLSQGGSYAINVDADGINALVASISWTDPAGVANTGTANDPTPALVNDLDIRVTQGGSTFYPYKLTSITTNGTGDNTVDPFEKVIVSGASGTYTVTVTHKGSLYSGSQNYSLIITGKSTSGSCLATIPTNLHTTNVGGNEVTFAWDNVVGASYEIRYRKTGTSTWTVLPTTMENITITGLLNTTEYEAQVQSICPDLSSSGFSSSVIFTTTTCVVCSSTYSNITDDWISNVTFNTINNNSSQGGSDSYEDFTSISTDVLPGSTNSISVSLTMNGAWTEHVWVWVDWNQDCDFTDTGEAYDLGDQTNTGTVNGNITVPNDALPGPTTMRIIEQYDVDPGPCNAHPTSYGETEDYTVNVISGGGCTYPTTQATGFGTSSVSSTSITISWTRGNGDDVVVLAREGSSVNADPVDGSSYTPNTVFGSGSEIGTGNFVVYNGTGTNVVLSGFNSSTTYYFAIYEYTASGYCYLTPALSGIETTTGGGIGCVNTYPYVQTFDAWTESSPGFSCTPDGTVNLEDDWTNLSGDNIDWDIYTGETESGSTGPAGDHTSTLGNYLYTEASVCYNNLGLISSPCFDFTSLTLPSLSFWYNMYGANMGTLAVQVSTDGGISWSSELWSASGNQGNLWLEAQVNLSAYATKDNCIIRWTGLTGTGLTSDMAIDDITVQQGSLPGEDCASAQDLASLTSPYNATTSGYADDFSFCGMGASPDRIFYIDVPNGQGIEIWQSFNDFNSVHTLRHGGSCPGTTEIGCIDDDDYTPINWTNLSGTEERVWFIVGGNSTSSGDFTLEWTFTDPIVSLPYTQNFDTQEYWTTSGVNASIWELGDQTNGAYGPASGHSGNTVYGTVLNTNYALDGIQAYCNSPRISLAGATNPVLSFWMDMESEAGYDGGTLQLKVNSGAWITIDMTDPAYSGNVPNDDDVDGLANNEDGWSGTSPAGDWEEVVVELFNLTTPGLSGLTSSDVIQARFWFGSDGSNNRFPGWYIDDFSVIEVPIIDLTWEGTSDTDWGNGVNWSEGAVPTEINNLTIPSAPVGGNFPEINSGATAVCNNLTIEAGAHLYIPSNNALTVNGTLINNGGTGGLVVKSLANNATGSLIHSTNGVDATVEKYLTEWKWHFIGMPVASGVAGVFHLPSGHSNIYLRTHIEATNTWDNWIVPVNTPLTLGRGYECWVDDNVVQDETIKFEGVLNAGDYTTGASGFYPLEFTTDHGLNLISNPYPSSLNANIISWSKTNIDNSVWTWDGLAGNYVYWNGSDGTGGGTGVGTLTGGIIPSMQSFFVLANGSNPSLTIPQTSRVHSSQAYYKESGNPNTLRLDVEGNNYKDALFVNFKVGATDMYDGLLDVMKIYGLEDAPQIYSIIPNNILSVNSLPEIVDYKIVNFGFECNTSGLYTIYASELESFDVSIPVYLEDILENTISDLRNNPVYSFFHNPENDPSRFLLHFGSPNGLSNTEWQEIRIYSFNDAVYIQQPEELTSEVVIYNMVGQEILGQICVNNSLNKIQVPSETGYYLVKVQSQNMLITEKVLIIKH
ncbi:MAG: S8 family serine peptidase [Bacteroidales bacterium]|nr:S8 family serine peptidase [Bacteroidales bacterium]MCF8404740.1 S8 family serine peptidase [Bacteroidales bacterium]